jgi:hypothetical protein
MTKSKKMLLPCALAIGVITEALSGVARASSIPPAISAFVAGDLVVSVEGNGGGTAGAAPYGGNQAAPLTLYEFALGGTDRATAVGSLVLPQTASGRHHVISGEYGSSSEGTLELSGDDRYLSIIGYGINADIFNANPGAYSPANSNTALGQSGSLTNQNTYTPVPRVVALIDANAIVDTSTAIYNVFNANNPRSAYTVDGSSFYVSGQGSGGDNSAGVFYATLGSTSGTSITGNDGGIGTSQDTRQVQVYNTTLYVSIDSRSGSIKRSYIGTLGTPGTLPITTANGGNGPSMLPGFGNNGGTGQVTVTTGHTNGINSIGQIANLSPQNFYFANPTTLYVADSGSPKNRKGSTSSVGVGGLQKWSLNPANNTWSLDYIVSAGLNLVPNTNTSGTTGLYGLTGRNVTIDGTPKVELFATNFTIGDTDQTFLYGITDVLAATSQPGETFTQLAEAPDNSNFKGVAFAPVGAIGPR